MEERSWIELPMCSENQFWMRINSNDLEGLGIEEASFLLFDRNGNPSRGDVTLRVDDDYSLKACIYEGQIKGDKYIVKTCRENAPDESMIVSSVNGVAIKKLSCSEENYKTERSFAMNSLVKNENANMERQTPIEIAAI